MRVKEKARFYLRDVEPEKCFWAHNGWIIRNLRELPVALENMDEETFCYHVNPEKNDFSKWIEDVIGDITLAKRIRKVGKKRMIRIVRERVRQLEKRAGEA